MAGFFIFAASMIRIGKIVATHGLNGAMVMTHVVGNRTWLKKGDVLMVEMQKGSLIPFFVTQCKGATDEEYLVNLEEVSTQQAAKKLVTKHVYVEENILAGLAQTSPLLWIGFNIDDAHYGSIGALADVMQTGTQWIGKLEYKGAEVLIPLVDATLKNIDLKKKTLHTTLPEGLLEIYQ